MAPLHDSAVNPPQVTVIDIIADGDPAMMSVHWPSADTPPDSIAPTTLASLRSEVAALHDAEHDHRSADMTTARSTLGRALWSLLDGPGRHLTHAMTRAQAHDEPLDLVLRFRTMSSATALANHPTTTWHWELLSPDGIDHPIADGRLRLTVDHREEVRKSEPRGREPEPA